MNLNLKIFLTGLAVVPALLLAGCASEPFNPDAGNNDDEPVTYTLVWADEFNGAEGQAIDSSRWAFDTGGHGWGNNQLEYNTDRTENVSLDGAGHLRIVARQEDFGGNSYTSGRIKTQGKFTQRYGKFEARMQLPLGQGMWPAFWLLGDDFSSVGWPACGEVDIMEYRGQYPKVVNGAMHGPGYSGATPFHGSYQLGGVDGFDDGFHTFAVEWKSSSITWLVDGQSYMTWRESNLPSGTDWVYDHPFFIILNLAVGGNYVGDPNGTTQFPQTLLVDYVRVYAAD